MRISPHTRATWLVLAVMVGAVLLLWGVIWLATYVGLIE
jgi:hypothetical protein